MGKIPHLPSKNEREIPHQVEIWNFPRGIPPPPPGSVEAGPGTGCGRCLGAGLGMKNTKVKPCLVLRLQVSFAFLFDEPFVSIKGKTNSLMGNWPVQSDVPAHWPRSWFGRLQLQSPFTHWVKALGFWRPRFFLSVKIGARGSQPKRPSTVAGSVGASAKHVRAV